MMKPIFLNLISARTKRVAKRFFAALVAVTMTFCTAAPISVWAATEESEERKAFFSVSEDVIDAFGREVTQAYGDGAHLIQNYVFTDTTASMTYEATDEETNVETYVHDFVLNPSEREVIIAVDTYLCEEDPDVELRITFDADGADETDADETGADANTELAFITDEGNVSIDELKSAVIRNDDELTYILKLDSQSLEDLSYYIDEPSKDYTMKFTDTDIDIKCVSMRLNRGCYGAVRGMRGELDYIDSKTSVLDTQKAGSAWAAVINRTDDGAEMLLTDASAVGFEWTSDDFEVSVADGIDDAALETLLAGLKSAYEEDEEEEEDVFIDITEGASSLYLDSYVFMDPEEVKTFTQKASELYYDAQINIFGTAMYITSAPDTMGGAEMYLGSIFDDGMTQGTVGLKVARLDDESIAGKLVLELPEESEIRFSKGDGTGYALAVNENGTVNAVKKTDDTASETAQTSEGAQADESTQTAESTQAGESTQTAESTQADESASVEESAPTNESVQTTESTQVDEIAQTTESSQADETSQTAENVQTDETTQTVELTEASTETSVAITDEAETPAEVATAETETSAESTEAEGTAETEEATETDEASDFIDGAQVTPETDPEGEYVDVIELNEPEDIAQAALDDADADAQTDEYTLIPVGIVLSKKFLKKASYCAVSEDMTICAVYDEKGRLEALADGYTEDDIAAYILLPSADEDVRLERADFIYSDVVSALAGQEYADVMLYDSIEADTVVNEFIDSETKYSQDIDIDGIIGTGKISATTKKNTADTENEIETPETTAETIISETPETTAEVIISETQVSPDTGAESEVKIISGGPGESQQSHESEETQAAPDPLPDADMPADTVVDSHASSDNYGEHYPGEDDGDSDGDSDPDSDTGTDHKDGNINGTSFDDDFEDVELSVVD